MTRGFLSTPVVPVLALFLTAFNAEPARSAEKAQLVQPQATATLSDADARLYRDVFARLGEKRLGAVMKLGERGQSALLKKVLYWYYLYNSGSGARFDDIVGFMERNPDWPHQDRLRQHAEEAIGRSAPAKDVIAYFQKNPPLTVAGRENYAAALKRTGDVVGAHEQIRAAWVEARFYGRRGFARQKKFLARHKGVIRREDHFARAEHLLWRQRNNNAYRHLSKMNASDRAVITAWGRYLRKNTSKKKINQAVRAVPADRKSHPGLLYAEMRRHTLRDRDSRARAILHAAPPFLGDADAWWIQRNIQARNALEERNYEEAYRLATNHGLASGKYFAEAEFLSGWIALRFLNKADVARLHFARLFREVKYPNDRARGAYWSGRTAEALGQIDVARSWYIKAAKFTVTYYGQLAAQRLGPGFKPVLPPPTTAATRAAFEGKELVQIARLLNRVGANKMERVFLNRIQLGATSAAERDLAAELALELGNRPAAVASARKAHRMGNPVVKAGFPVLSLPPIQSGRVDPMEDALILAVIRQESQFHEKAKSGAGARGLMQLMPRTARLTARKLRVRYIKAKLTRDPDYNIRLGRAYLSGLLSDFGGNYPLALAAYNAGPGRADRWIGVFGDPRSGAVDPVDWVELIPFRETRNYVQRVLENLQVYRWRLGQSPLVPARISDVYMALGTQGTAIASDTFILPATSIIEGDTPLDGGIDDAEEKNELRAGPDDAFKPDDDCDPELPASDVDSCL